MGLFLNSKNFLSTHNRNFNDKVIHIIMLNKTAKLGAFFLILRQKPRHFKNFLKVRNVRISDRCHFILLTVFLLEQSHLVQIISITAIFNSSVLSAFYKS